MRKRIYILLALLPLLTYCSVQEPEPQPSNADVPIADTVPGEAILLLSEEAANSYGPTADPELLEELGISSIERLKPGNSKRGTAPPGCTAGTGSATTVTSPAPRRGMAWPPSLASRTWCSSLERRSSLFSMIPT